MDANYCRHVKRTQCARPPIIRFLEKIQIDTLAIFDGSPCWKWQGAKDKSGYGRFHAERDHYAHRVSVRLFIQPNIPDDMETDHLCRNRDCVSPLHLRLITRRQNMDYVRDGITHCLRGHEFTEANTHIDARGGRICKKCRYLRIKEYRQRQRDALNQWRDDNARR